MYSFKETTSPTGEYEVLVECNIKVTFDCFNHQSIWRGVKMRKWGHVLCSWRHQSEEALDSMRQCYCYSTEAAPLLAVRR